MSIVPHTGHAGQQFLWSVLVAPLHGAATIIEVVIETVTILELVMAVRALV